MTETITLSRDVVEGLFRTALNAFDSALKETESEDTKQLSAPEKLTVRRSAAEQLFVIAKLTVRLSVDPDPWVWERLEDNGTWTPFNPFIHGPDMWRLEQALRNALAEPVLTFTEDKIAEYVSKRDAERAELRAEIIENLQLNGWRKIDEQETVVKLEPATFTQIAESYSSDASVVPMYWVDGWREAEKFHGITKEVK